MTENGIIKNFLRKFIFSEIFIIILSYIYRRSNIVQTPLAQLSKFLFPMLLTYRHNYAIIIAR